MSTRKNKKERTIIQVDTLIERIEKFYETYKKQINIISTVTLVIIAAIVLFFVWYMPKQQLKAEVAIYKAEQYFAADSLTLALNGDGMYEGLLDVIDNYGLTKTAKRARFMAGISYLKIGDFDNAIRYLKKVKSKDKFISVQSLASIGDAYVEKNDFKNGLKYYKKAIKKNPNELITPIYILRAAQLCEMDNQWEEAASLYERIQKEYPNSNEAADIEKRLEYVKAKQGK
ncbi:MAG: tetratricopeptide repeat protein [Bacteroidales bacterium]